MVDYTIEVLRSAAGYYIGQLDKEGLPYSRLSGYFRTYKEAEHAMKNGFALRDCFENKKLNEQLIKAGLLR